MSENYNYKPIIEERAPIWLVVDAFKLTITTIAVILPVSFVSQLFQNGESTSLTPEELKRQVHLQNKYK